MQIDNDKVANVYRDILNHSGLNSREKLMLTDMLVSNMVANTNSEVRKDAGKRYLQVVYKTKSIYPFEIYEMKHNI